MLARTRRGGRERRLPGLIVLGGWFAVEALVLSFAGGIVHPYYVSALAPGAAAMIGAGAVLFAQLARRRDRLLLLLLLGLGATVAGQLVLLHHDHYLVWLAPVLVTAFALTALVTLLPDGRLPALLARGRGIRPWAIAPMLGLLLIAPPPTRPPPGSRRSTARSRPPDPGAGGTRWRRVGRRRAAGLPRARRLPRGARRNAPLRRLHGRFEHRLAADPDGRRRGRAGRLRRHGPGDRRLAAAALVAREEARYVLLGGGYSERGGNRASAAVLRACRQVPTATWGGPPLEPYSFVLFDCRGHEAALREGSQPPSDS